MKKETAYKDCSLLLTLSVSFLAVSLVFILPILFGSYGNRMFLVRTAFYIIALPILYVFSKKHVKAGERTNNVTSKVLSFVFSQFLIIGENIFLFHSFILQTVPILSISYWVISTVILCSVLRPIIELIFQWLNSYKLENTSSSLNYRRLFLTTVVARLVCMGLFFPCIFDFDAALGLRTMIAPDEVISNHHPYAVQAIHAIFYKIGQWLGNPSFGFALLSLFSILISSLIVIYTTKVVANLLQKRKGAKFVGYTLALFPLFPLLSITCTKDGFFAYSFLFYLTTLLQIYATKGECLKSARFILVNIVAILTVCLTRHQGVYLIAVEILILLFVYSKYWKYILGIGFITGLFIFSYNQVYLKKLNVEPINKKEALNMLFQQTAYCLKVYPEDVTNDEYNSISRILDIDSIKQNYEYNITDNVKKYYYWTEGDKSGQDMLIHFRHVNHAGEDEALSAYKKVWAKMLMRHPDIYIDAWLCVISGFFYNNGICLFTFDTDWISSQATTPNYGFIQFSGPSKAITKINGYLSNLPVTELIFGIPFYNWIIILLLSLLFVRRNRYAIAAFTPVILSLLFLLICPVASGRYEYPIIMSVPVLFMFIVLTNKSNKTDEKSNCSSDSML